MKTQNTCLLIERTKRSWSQKKIVNLTNKAPKIYQYIHQSYQRKGNKEVEILNNFFYKKKNISKHKVYKKKNISVFVFVLVQVHAHNNDHKHSEMAENDQAT